MIDIERDPPWIAARHEGWTLRVLVGLEPLEGLLDVEAHAPDGQRLLGTVATLADVAEVMDNDPSPYFWIGDLIILRELTEQGIFEALVALVDSGEAWRAMDVAGPDDEPPNY